jgi:hypothetical protein
MNGQNIRIRLKAFDHRVLDASTREIVSTAKADRRERSRADAAADTDREIHREPVAAHRQEKPRAVRDAHAQAPLGHRRSDSADRRRADEARSGGRRGRRDQALSGAGRGKDEPMRSGVIAQKVGMTRVFNDAGEHSRSRFSAWRIARLSPSAPKKRTATRPFSSASGFAKVKNTSKALRGHFRQGESVEPKRKLVPSSACRRTTVDRRRRRADRRALRRRPEGRCHRHVAG